MHILLMAVLARNAVKSHLTECALVRPGVRMRVLVFGKREFCRETSRTMRAPEWFVLVLSMNTDHMVTEF